MTAGSGTDLSGYNNQVYEGGNPPIIKQGRMTSGNPKPGWIISGVAAAEPDVVEGSGTIVGGVGTGSLGVLKETSEAEEDLDIAFVDNDNVDFYPQGQGIIVWIPLKVSAGAVKRGDRIVLSATTDGHGELETYTTPSTPNAGENKVAADQVRYNQKQFLGKAMEDSADVAAVRWIPVLI